MATAERIDWDAINAATRVAHDKLLSESKESRNGKLHAYQDLLVVGEARPVFSINGETNPDYLELMLEQYKQETGEDYPDELRKKWEKSLLSESLPTAYDPKMIAEVWREQGQTQAANAKRLARDFGRDFHWVEKWGSFVCWDGIRWTPDCLRQMPAWAKLVYERLWSELEDYSSSILEPNEKEIKAIGKFIKETGSAFGIRGMLELSKSEPGVAVSDSVFDVNPDLLNVANGTLNLHTQSLQPHNREDFLTKFSPVQFDPAAECPLWRQFIADIMQCDADMAGFLQRAIGYCLTGHVHSHDLFVCYGKGRNGKSTFLNVIQWLLGVDYSMKAPIDLLMSKSTASHPTALTDLRGRRFVACIESDQGRRLDEALVKELTGGDAIRARRMGKDFFEFPPTHKIWLATNHKPSIRGTDDGIWERIKLIPFSAQFVGDNQDQHLPEKLKAELSGILNWALAGLKSFFESGLQTPAKVSEATSQYRIEMDVTGKFIANCCAEHPEMSERAGALYDAYAAWIGDHPMSRRMFGDLLTERGYEKFRSNGIWYRGIVLLPDFKIKRTNEKKNSEETAEETAEVDG